MPEENRETAVIDYEHKLNQSDIFNYAQQIAELDDEDDSIKTAQARSAASYKMKINENNAHRKKLSRCIKTGIEIKSGECEVNFNHYDSTVEYTLIETGKIVKVRPMTTEERQLNLFTSN
jgi:hypothetical protein